MTIERTRSINFSAKKHVKKTKTVNKNRTVFVLYAPERIMLRSREAKVINMQTKPKLPHAKNSKIWLLPFLIKENISLESCTLINDSNTNDFFKMGLFNRNVVIKTLHQMQTLPLKNSQELTFITLLNEGKEKFKFSVSYETI